MVNVRGECPETGGGLEDISIISPRGATEVGQGAFRVKLDALGQNKIVAKGKSSLGVWGTGEALITVTNLPPHVAVEVAEEAHRGEEIPVSLVYRDDGGESPELVEWTVDNGRVAEPGAVATTVSASEVGELKLGARAVDEDSGEGSHETTISIVNRAPTVELSSGGGEYFRNIPIKLDISANDADSEDDDKLKIMAFVNGKEWGEGDLKDLTIGELGDYTIKVVAEDPFGGVGEAETKVSIVNALPEVEIMTNEQQLQVGEETEIAVRASDPDGSDLIYSFDINGAKLPPSNKPSTIVGFSKKGKHSIVITVTDPDGGTVSKKTEVVVR